MQDQLENVIAACAGKVYISVPATVPHIELVTRTNLRVDHTILIRTFQTAMRKKLGLDIIVVGGGFGCSKVSITVNVESTEIAGEILRLLLSSNVFRQEAAKVGFSSARLESSRNPYVRVDLTTGDVGPGVSGLLLFISYSHKDDEHRKQLIKFLSMKRKGTISVWHDRVITAGREWEGEIDEHIQRAELIVLLISVDFLSSDYCYDEEMTTAINRHNRGEARVVPIIIRPVDWSASEFSKLQVLPKDGKAVTLWDNQDEAWTDVSKGMGIVVEEILKEKMLRLQSGM